MAITPKNNDPKMPKMTISVILDQKLIVSNDY